MCQLVPSPWEDFIEYTLGRMGETGGRLPGPAGVCFGVGAVPGGGAAEGQGCACSAPCNHKPHGCSSGCCMAGQRLFSPVLIAESLLQPQYRGEGRCGGEGAVGGGTPG